MNHLRCSIEGCGNLQQARGWCSTHYTRWRKHGDPFKTLRQYTMGPWRERFWTKVNKTETCWLWMAGTCPSGYGHFAISARDQRLSHRVAYELLVGPVPRGLTIDHLCRNRLCVNPTHMEPVSNKVNVLRGTSILANNARKTHCVRGHLFDQANTYYAPSRPNQRACRACLRERMAIRRSQYTTKDLPLYGEHGLVTE